MAQLDVALDQIGRAQFAFDLLLHRAQFAQRIEIQVDPINKAAEFAEQPLTDGQRARHRACAQQRRALPGLAEALIENERASGRADQRRGTPAGPQPQVDAKAMGRKNLRQPFAQPLGRGQLRQILLDVKHIDQIDIRAEVEFIRAKFAHREDAEMLGDRGSVQFACRQGERGADTVHREPRHRLDRRDHAPPGEQVANRDREEAAPLESTQRCRRPGVIRRILLCRGRDRRAPAVKSRDPFGPQHQQSGRDQFRATQAEDQVVGPRVVTERVDQ